MKNSKILFALTAIALGISLSACSDDDKSSDDTCTKSVCLDSKQLSQCDTKTGVATTITCENGCANDACAAAPDKPITEKCTKSVCLDNKQLSQCDTKTGVATTITCENGCANNACAAAPDKPSTGVKEGDPCDADTFVEKCDSDAAYYCEDAKVVKIDCGLYGFVCDFSTNENYAYCYQNDEVCDTEGQETPYCEEDDTYGTTVSPLKCVKMNSGKLRWITDFTKDTQFCSETALCDATGTKCVDGALNVTTKTCDDASFVASCDANNVLTFCDAASAESKKTVEQTKDCSKLDYICDSVSVGEETLTECMPKDSTCKQNETASECGEVMDGIYATLRYECTRTEKGNWHFIMSENYSLCKNACNADGTDCDAQGYDDFDE